MERIELESLYKELETYNDYIEYKKNARIFNDLITNIQKNVLVKHFIIKTMWWI